MLKKLKYQDQQTLKLVVKGNHQAVSMTIANDFRMSLGMETSDKTICQEAITLGFHGHATA